jgi:GNAT superfamily N-acetyltransferase
MSETISTSFGALPIRPALPADLPALVALLKEAQAWMDARNIHQWVPGAHDPAIVEGMIAQGILYAVEREGVIATIALKPTLPAHWTPIDEPFGYLSTLHVARQYAAHGIGAALVRWGEATLREQGKVWACLDCSGKNPKLCQYYVAQGYSAIGEVETYPGYIERMMQKWLKDSDEQ